MSSIFEGILCPAEPSAVRKDLISTNTDLTLAVSAVPGDVTAVIRESLRSELRFSAEIDDLAANLSSVYGSSLVVRYDDRIGHRSSILYKEGKRARSFGEEDETYVLLDEEGEPLRDGARFKLAELTSDEEYETIENAIQAGLAEFGKGDWESLHELLTS